MPYLALLNALSNNSSQQTILFAVIALFALVSAIPAPQQPVARQPIEPRQAGVGPASADDLEAASEDKDLKGASSFGYGYYGYPGYGYGGYGYGYPGYYGYGREFHFTPCPHLILPSYLSLSFTQVDTRTTATEDCTEDTGTKRVCLQHRSRRFRVP